MFIGSTVSSINADQGFVQPEVNGRGRPMFLLHGWLGSRGLWQETREVPGASYRTYAGNLRGFGGKGIIIHPDQGQPMSERIPQTRLERFARAGTFRHKLKDFFNEEKPTA